MVSETDNNIAPVLDEIRCQLAYGKGLKRLFHGRGKCFSGWEHLCIDDLGDQLLLTDFAGANPEAIKVLGQCIQREFPDQWTAAAVQQRHPERLWYSLWGDWQIDLVVQEHLLKYQLKLGGDGNQQNHGLFLDAGPARAWLKEHAQSKRILNLFSYTCAFSVAALAGDAAHVTNVDMSKGCLSRGRRNHELNNLDMRAVKFLPHNILKSMGSLGRKGPYDLVIIDPPSNQGQSFQVERDYPKILRRLPEMLKPGSQVLGMLNAPHLDWQWFTELFDSQLFTQSTKIPRATGFREADEGKGLKAAVWEFVGN